MKWLSVALFSLICGYAIVRYLISSPLDMSLYGAIAIGCFFVALWSLFCIRKTSKRIAAIGLMIIGIISGYLITCTAALKPNDQKNAFSIAKGSGNSRAHGNNKLFYPRRAKNL